jgi:hypothetical protein
VCFYHENFGSDISKEIDDPSGAVFGVGELNFSRVEVFVLFEVLLLQQEVIYPFGGDSLFDFVPVHFSNMNNNLDICYLNIFVYLRLYFGSDNKK